MITPPVRLLSTAELYILSWCAPPISSVPLLFQVRPSKIVVPLKVVLLLALVFKLPEPLMLPPPNVRALSMVRLPAPVSVPEVSVKLLTIENPLSDRVPPETANEPATSVAPDTASEPPETLREFALLMVSAAMLSVPMLCVTATPGLELINTESNAPGRALPLQLPGVAQSKPPTALVKVMTLPPA